jgi:hemerythrin HHE cation binding domain-containing protein
MAQTQSEPRQVAADQAGKGATGSGSTEPKANPADPKNPKNGASTASDADPTELLKSDHRHVEQLFGSFQKATNADQKSQLAAQICTELMVHTLIEEEIFYRACKGHMEQQLLEEAQVEHDGAKTLIIEIRAGSPADQFFDAKVKVLSEEIKHHVREEEKPDGILARAKEAGVATPDLAKQMAALKQELMKQAQAGTLGPPVTRSFRVRTNAGTKQPSQEHNMARGSSSTMERERDERGRFVSDDDDDRDYRRRSSSRSRYDDDDRRRSMPSRDEEGRFVGSRSRYDDDDDRRRSMLARDDEGRFTSSRSRYDDDDDRRSSRSRSRYDEDDDDRRGRGGHGGWFGDPKGHSEASRRGWEERGGSRSNYRDEDDGQRRHMPARDDEGRFTSSRSRYYDDEDDRRGGRGHGGWYGDPEGHSEASRGGWEERGGSRTRYRDDDDDRRRYMPARDDEGRFTSSRSRYDDDDDDRRGSRGHGGWYGYPEGHSQAARRGRR